jgi:hypothetical protein
MVLVMGRLDTVFGDAPCPLLHDSQARAGESMSVYKARQDTPVAPWYHISSVALPPRYDLATVSTARRYQADVLYSLGDQWATCRYCRRHQKRPDDGGCVSCGAPLP